MGSCGASFAKIILIVTNVIVSLFALFFFILGLGLTVASDIMKDVIWPEIQKAAASQSSGDVDLTALFDPQLDLFGKLKILALPMLILSCCILVLAFVGCYGACCGNKCLLGVYSAAMTVIVLAILVVCLVAYFRYDEVMPEVKSRLAVLVKTEYVNETHPDVISLIVTTMQDVQDCCGINNGGDYDGSTVLYRRFPNQKIPISCCPNYKTADNATLMMCTTTNPQDESVSNYNLGCFRSLEKEIKNYLMYVMIAAGCAMAFLAILCILGWCLFAHIVRSDKAKEGTV